MDGEGAIVPMTQSHNQRGIVVNLAGSGSHVPTIERKIQVIQRLGDSKLIILQTCCRPIWILIIYNFFLCI